MAINYINQDYTITIFAKNNNTGENEYSNNFNLEASASAPAGWTVSNAGGDHPGPKVFWRQDIGPPPSEDNMFCLTGTGVSHLAVVQPPYSGDYWRWVELDTVFRDSIVIKYSIMAGNDASGSLSQKYHLTNQPEGANNEWLYFQYFHWKWGWTNYFIHGSPSTDPFVNTITEFKVVLENLQKNPVKLRWISRSQTANPSYDHWGLYDLDVKPRNPGSFRLSNNGVFNIQGQTVDAFHKTFVGDQR